jgi:hypothetical protein
VPLTLSTAMLIEKNRQQSDTAWTWIWEVDITGAGGPLRLAMYDQPIVFHGLVFDPTVMQVDSLEDATHAALVNMRVSFENVTQTMVALYEQYWVTQATPLWSVRQWQVSVGMPDEMPFERFNLYSVQQTVTDFLTAAAELVLEGYTLTSIIPKNRYISTNGFTNLPRRG